MVRQDDLKYAWPLFCNLWDDLRAFNDRKDDPKLKNLNPMFEKQLEDKLRTVPPPENEKPKQITLDFIKHIRPGGMKD